MLNQKPHEDNPFLHFYRLGYLHLQPVASRSKIPSRYDFGADGLGGGRWVKVGNGKFEATPDSMAIWATWPDVSVSMQCTDLVPIDIDCDYSAALSAEIKRIALETLGPAPERVGKAPKRLLLYRPKGVVKFRSIVYRLADDPTFHVETLAGRSAHFVAIGKHKDTGQPYVWTERKPHAELTEVSQDDVDRFYARIEAELGLQRASSVSGRENTDRSKIDQQALLAPSPERVAALVRRMPNTLRDYYKWVAVAVRIRASLGDLDGSDPVGIESFEDYSNRIDESLMPNSGTESPARVYASIEPPFELGWKSLIQLAEDLKVDVREEMAEAYFEQPTDAEKEQFDTFQEGARKAEQAKRAEKLKWHDYDDLGKVVRPRPYLIKGLMFRGSMSLFYGPPGCGKTYLMMDIALHIAAGLPWGGVKVRKGSVLYFCSEGGMVEMELRIAALRVAHGHLDDIAMRFIPARINLKADKDTDTIIAMLREADIKPDLIIIDTLIRAAGDGDDSDIKTINAMMANGEKIVDAFTDAHVAWVHHTGKKTAAGPRGSSALTGTVALEIPIDDGKIVVDKNKHGLEGMTWNFTKVIQTLGIDDEGDPITACSIDVLDTASNAAGSGKGGRPDIKRRKLLRLLKDNPEGLTRAEIVKGIGGNTGSAQRLLDRLKAKGEVHSSRSKWLLADVDDAEFSEEFYDFAK